MLMGLVGFAGSGKGSVADILATDHNFTKMAFADPLKDAAAVIFDWPRHLLEGDTEASRTFRERPDKFWSEHFKKEFTPRMALQQLGTEACRNVFHQDIWVLNLEKRIRDKKNVVVTDVRFPNEIDCIKKLGGTIIRIKRGPEPEWYSTAEKENNTHPDSIWMLYDRYETMDRKYTYVHISEYAWIGNKNIDMVLENTGTLETLQEKVKSLLTEIR